jgi:hypothetical protein
MTQKIAKSLIVILIIVGLTFTVFNFVPQAKADEVYYGTMTWKVHHDPELEDYHIGLGWYCLDDPCDCSVVIHKEV